MKSFKDYLNEKKKKFVAIYFTKETNNKLKTYAIENGFDLTVNYAGDKIPASGFDFHCTIFFSDNDSDLINGKFKVDGYKARATGLKLLGVDKNIPVLSLNTAFENIRDNFEKLGLRDQWPQWVPHVSLSYNKTDIPSINNIKTPDFDIVAEYVIVKDQND